MSGTNIKITAIDEKSAHLQEVIDLGRANSSTLGFLPNGAFIKYAADKQLLVALGHSRQVLGYVIYAISIRKALVYIVHLCVQPSHRRQGVAETLFKKLKDLTKIQFRGIRVHCRRDYPADKLWPMLGFIAAMKYLVVVNIKLRSRCGGSIMDIQRCSQTLRNSGHTRNLEWQ